MDGDCQLGVDTGKLIQSKQRKFGAALQASNGPSRSGLLDLRYFGMLSLDKSLQWQGCALRGSSAKPKRAWFVSLFAFACLEPRISMPVTNQEKYCHTRGQKSLLDM
mmetsp:Transcript_18673/g.43519  ORF Transcript_18673/g.43519 Transcript_18673/m.43519 type:complete len:107 (+) Transcript_18673:951-1271(+)